MAGTNTSVDDDDPDLLPCYRHPKELTALHCLQCERPICVDCAVHGAVGIKCPDCAKVSRAARGVVPTQRLVRGAAAGAIVAGVLGTVASFVNIPFLGFIVAYFVGVGVAEATRRGSGGFRDTLLARLAATFAALGMLAYPAILLLSGYELSARFVTYAVLYAAIAAYGAFSRAN
ncbi:MAG: hypothetical protein JWM86_2054 [Thermoleophilia bacterium]|nr:hypothetical protein [Thermoleophilia bacterium]